MQTRSIAFLPLRARGIASSGGPLFGRRTIEHQSSSDGAGQRVVPAPARLAIGPLAEPRALHGSVGPDDATCARGHRAATTRRAAGRAKCDSCAPSKGSTFRRASRAPTCLRWTWPSRCSRSRIRAPQGRGRGASLLWRPLDRGDRRCTRDLGPHRSRGLGVGAGVALPNADRVPCPLTAGVASKNSSQKLWRSLPGCVRISSPACVGPMPECARRSPYC